MNEGLRFGRLEIRADLRQVWLDGAVVPLGSRALDLLLLLAENRDRVVTKDEIFARVWPNLVVEENNLSVQVSTLRRVLGAEAIKTVSGRGYQLVLQPLGQAEIPRTVTGNLGRREPKLLGRDIELGQLVEAFDRESLVTVCGLGGVGKTALALNAARRLAQRHEPADGAWLVDLSVVGMPSALPVAVCQTVGIEYEGGRDALTECLAHLRHRQLMLVLDNCEHLVEAAAEFVSRLLAVAPEVKVLATSQEPLRVSGERVLRLNPLQVPASATSGDARDAGAVQLMLERLRGQFGEGFEPADAEFVELVEICRQLDGIPLALEFAASRVPLLGLAGVRSRLHDRLRLLAGGARAAPPRHRSMQAALEWSFGLLSERGQFLLERLAVFPAGFSLQGAAFLLPEVASDDLLEHLQVLVQRSLVEIVAGERPRYRLLETTRAFALEALTARADGIDWQHRLAQAMVKLCLHLARERDNARLWQEMPNARAALGWSLATPGQEATAVTLATYTAVVLATDGAVGEALDNLRRVEPLVAAPLSDAVAARFWHWIGRLGFEGRLPNSECIESLRKADAMFLALDEPRHRHACQRHLAEAWLRSGRPDLAEHHLTLARELEGVQTSAVDRMRRLRVDALLADTQGRSAEALRLAQSALTLAEAHGIDRYRMQLRADMAWMHLNTGQAEAAVSAFQEVLVHLDDSIRQGLARARALSGLTAAFLAAARIEEAIRAAWRSVPALQRANLLRSRCDVFAWLAVAVGDARSAALLLGAGDDFATRSETERDPISQLARRRALLALSPLMSQEEVSHWQSQGAATGDAELIYVLRTVFGIPNSPSLKA
ncbi:MAG: winged helix-turn-helix domain-containing protein [Burkholderiaceae bacterium]|jgi:predicted ATPase/DNA-binding winged helix-turn-helix (wHTH) protein|nr:winged helix-turn-helix domain-containing protein [Burkholderiaceae bacterium]